MIVINGMPITDNLVDFLNSSYDYLDEDMLDTNFDSDVNTMLELNDYMIDVLTMTNTDQTDEIKTLSDFLINIKAARDRMKKLSTLLKECRTIKTKS